MKFRVNFTDSISITYNLIDHEIATHWATLISQQSIKDCCEINHYSGCHNPTLLNNRILRLYELIDIINSYVPNRITKLQFTKENFHGALNTMHVHFPDLEQKVEYQHLQKYLSEYNDTIHWLEPALKDYYNNRTDNSKFSIKLDFNKVRPALELHEIPKDACQFFNGYFTFGQLMLHYVHVGRHACELFFANDLICPKDQYVPQTRYNATVRMHFCDNKLDYPVFRQMFKKSWEKFYVLRGGKDFFGCAIDDPDIRFGYCQIGSLNAISINDQPITMPKTIQEIRLFRDRLVTTNIINWEINGA